MQNFFAYNIVFYCRLFLIAMLNKKNSKTNKRVKHETGGFFKKNTFLLEPQFFYSIIVLFIIQKILKP